MEDASILSEHGIDEKKFIVIMVTKPKPAEPVQAAPAANPSPAPAPAAQTAPTTAPATPAAVVPPATRPETASTGYHT